MKKDVMYSIYSVNWRARYEYRIFFGKLDRKRSLWAHRHRGEDNIKNNILRTEYGDVGCIQMAYNRVQRQAFVLTVMSLRVL
jgi:hypothetical protein